MGRTIRQLKSLIEKNYRERSVLNDELADLQTRKALPALKKKYEGKYFKYDNGYDSTHRWPVYTYCREVNSEHQAVCARFEKDPQRGWVFTVGSVEGLFLFQTPVTREEFDQAATEMFFECQSMVDYD